MFCVGDPGYITFAYCKQQAAEVGYIPAVPHMQPEEMAGPEFVPTIAASLRRFHDIPAPVRCPVNRYAWMVCHQSDLYRRHAGCQRSPHPLCTHL